MSGKQNSEVSKRHDVDEQTLIKIKELQEILIHKKPEDIKNYLEKEKLIIDEQKKK